MEQLIRANLHYLSQAESLLERMDDGRFATPAAGFYNSSVGGHLRHCIEHYLSFLAGMEDGRVDYDCRARDERVETRTGDAVERVREVKAAMKPVFGDLPEDVTEENMQARIRGVFLMSLSNKSGRLLLTTGNKSELAVGYCTMYGDMCGGLAVISDLPKMQVYALSRINRDKEIIPWDTIDKPPSAELRPDQKDQEKGC